MVGVRDEGGKPISDYIKVGMRAWKIIKETREKEQKEKAKRKPTCKS